MNIKLYNAQRKFLGKCPVCGTPLKKVKDVNLLRCENPQCEGVRKYSRGKNYYTPYCRFLGEKGMNIYNHLFENS